MRVVFSLTISSFLTQLVFINLSPVNNQQIRLSFGVGNVGFGFCCYYDGGSNNDT